MRRFFRRRRTCLALFRKKTYIGQRLPSSQNAPSRRTEPLFPISLWNVHDRVKQALPRNNNSVESWHNKFNNFVACAHPNTFKFIDFLKKEMNLSTFGIQKILVGDGICRKPTYCKTDARILNLVSRYDGSNKLEFLKNI